MKYIEASKLEALPRYDVVEGWIHPDDQALKLSEGGEYVEVKRIRALIEAAPEVSSEPVAYMWICAGLGDARFELLGKDCVPPHGTTGLYTTPQDQTALIRELVEWLDSAHYEITRPADQAHLTELLTRAKEAIK